MNKLTFRWGFKAEANRIAVRIREQMGLTASDPIDPIEVCREFDIELIPLSQSDIDTSAFLGKDRAVFSAVTVPRGARTAIVHNDSHHRYRQRSNICHELGHCFLGHKHTPPLTSSGERIRDGSIEGEANFLAGALLLTNEGALHVLRKGLLPVAQGLYGISKPMLDYRLNISGAQAIYRRGH
jgi:Zn-dependent peptidase ImmA (M78 family)